MGHEKYIVLCLFSFITVQSVESTNIYLVNLEREKDSTPHDYNAAIPVKDYKIDDKESNRPPNYNFDSDTLNRDDNEMTSNTQRNIFLCHTAFAEGNLNNLKQCLQSVKNNERTNGYAYFEKPIKNNKRFLDTNIFTFSRDYVDVKDLGRTNNYAADNFAADNYEADNFADDYIDVNDFRHTVLPECDQTVINESECIPRKQALPSRKANSGIKKGTDQNYDNVQVRTKKKHKKLISGLSSESSKSSEDNKSNEIEKDSNANKEDVSSAKEDNSAKKEDEPHKKKQKSSKRKPYSKEYKPASKRKPKRYQVVTYKIASGAASDEYSRKKRYDSDAALSEFSSELEYYPKSDLSAEATTKKPKRTETKKNVEDQYVFLQGNKLYGNDFRRRRLPHFLPKRYHWGSDEYQNLGYYWFQGPKGKYPSPHRTIFD